MKTHLQSLHGNFEGDPIVIDESSFYKNDFVDFEVCPNKCIENSYKFAVSNNCKMVEGLLLVLIDDNVVSIEPHCWNKMDTAYYDTTIDHLPLTKEYQDDIGEKIVKYHYLYCVEYLPNESGYHSNISTFYYNYDCLVDYIKSGLNNDGEEVSI